VSAARTNGDPLLTLQPIGPVQALRQTIAQRGVAGLYAGVTAVVIGNAAKAGVRFTTYDQFKALLRDDEGKLSAPRSMLAGLGAGMMEAVIAVTPSETIKWVGSWRGQGRGWRGRRPGGGRV
jgi:solute carrier family 25 citrate transporter 1